MSVVDLSVLVAYLIGMALVGVYFAKRNVTTDAYFLGGRSFKGWVIGLSLVGTSISAVSFVGFPADAFKTAYLRLLPNLMLPLGLITASYFFLPFYRKNGISSAYQYLELRFGPGVRVYGAAAFVAVQLMRISSILYLVSELIKSLTGLNLVAAIILAGAVVAFYTIVGGLTAVIWTDVMQTLLLAVVAVICLIIVIHNVPGGFSHIIDMAIGGGKFNFADYQNGALQPVSWKFTLSSKTAAMMLFVGANLWLRDYSCMQATIQRYAAASSLREGRKSLWVCGLWSIPIWIFFMFLGTSLWVFYQINPTTPTTEMLTGGRKAEEILPYFIVHQFPVGLSGLVIAAACAAAQSAISSSINAVTLVLVGDVYRRHLVKHREDRHYLTVSRCIAAAVAVLMILGAIWFAKADTQTLQDTTTALTSILGGGLLGLFMFGMLTTRGDGRAAVCGIVCTLLFVTWAVLAGNGLLPSWFPVPCNLYYVDLVGNCVMFGVGYLAAILLFPAKKTLADLTVWTQQTSLETAT